MTNYIVFVCGLLLFTPSALCDPFCNDENSTDLVGVWICADNWLIEAMPVVEFPYPNAPPLLYWGYVFETPKFYVVSKIKISDHGFEQAIDGRPLEVNIEYWDDTVTEPYSRELNHWMPLHADTSADLTTFDGFSRLSRYWRIKVEVLNEEPPLSRRFAFFARADLPQMNFKTMRIDMDTPQAFPDGRKASAAPTGNTCGTVENPVPRRIVSKYKLEGFYNKYTSAYGVPILSNYVVDDRALQRACYVVRFMLAGRKDIRDHMYNNNGRVTIIGRRQTVPMVPEMRQFYWWTRRAAGGTYQLPVNVGAEENMLCERGDTYAREQDIFMHEFAHGIHLISAYTAIPSFNSRLQGAFNSARRSGLWSNTYANTDNREYFAEGVQAYFNQQREGPPGGDGIQNNIDTRAELRRHDYNLYRLVNEIFPCTGDYIPRCDDISQSRGLSQYLELDCSRDGGTGVTPENSCKDDNDYCDEWASTGECEANPDYMLVNCRKSCNTCEETTSTESTTSTTEPTTMTPENNCEDNNIYCEHWASTGECEANPDYMLVHCRKSCEICGETTSPTTTELPTSTTELPPSTTEVPSSTTEVPSSTTEVPSSTTEVPPSTTEVPSSTTQPITDTTQTTSTSTIPPTTPTTTEEGDTCVDNNMYCERWSSIGECTSNPDYMLVHCKKSCDQCKTENCQDKHRHCSSWQSYCSSNEFVKVNCEKSCGKC